VEGGEQAAELLGALGVVAGQGIGVDGLAGLDPADHFIDELSQAGVGAALHGWRWRGGVHGSSPSNRLRSRIRARYWRFRTTRSLIPRAAAISGVSICSSCRMTRISPSRGASS